MSSENKNGQDKARGTTEIAAALAGTLAALSPADRWTTLARLADQLAAGAAAPQKESDQEAALRTRLREAEERLATQHDELASLRSDLSHAQKELAISKDRVAELDELRKRNAEKLVQAGETLRAREATIVAHEDALEKLQFTIDDLRTAAPAAANSDLEPVVEKLRSEHSALQREYGDFKNHHEEIVARMREELNDARSNPTAKTAAGAVTSTDFSEVLKHFKDSPLGIVLPGEEADAGTVLSALIVLEMLVETTESVDHSMRAIMEHYAPNDESLKSPWQTYGRQTIREGVRATFGARGAHPKLLKLRLRKLNEWLNALIFGSDMCYSPEELSRSLRLHLTGPGRNWNDRTRIREYVDVDGPLHFAEEMRRLRAKKILLVMTEGAQKA
ncbi:MAG: hypothetical protein AB7N71_01135 [Phycisphaerae bacterium]